jgi:hypothetical protein
LVSLLHVKEHRIHTRHNEAKKFGAQYEPRSEPQLSHTHYSEEMATLSPRADPNDSFLAAPRVRDVHEDRREERKLNSLGSPTNRGSTRDILRRSLQVIPEQPRISERRQHSLDPVEKFLRYGRFPCKLVLNIINFSLLTALLVGCHVPEAQKEETQRTSLRMLFMPAGFLNPTIHYVREPTAFFGDISTFRGWLQMTTEKYYNITATESAHYNYWAVPGANTTRNATVGDIMPLSMSAHLRVASGRLSPQRQDVLHREVPMTLNQPFGLFANIDARIKQRLSVQNNFGAACAARREAVAWGTTPSTMYYNPCRTGEIDNNIFDVASDVTVTIRLRSFDALDRFTETTSFYDWEVKQYYNFIPNGLISMTFTADALLHREASTVTAWMGVAITALVFSIWELALRLRALRKITILKARRAKERAALEKKMNESRPIADASVESRGGKSRKTGAGTDSTSDDDQPTGRLRLRGEQCAKWKMDLRNSMGKSWTLWAIGVDVLTIVFLVDKLLSTFAYAQPQWLRYCANIVVAFAIFGSSSLFISYMRFFPKLYVLIMSSNVAWPHFRRFFAAVLPLYTAAALFGNIVFGDYAKEFSTFWESLTALYAATCGDSLLQMFQVTGNATDIVLLRQLGYLYSATCIAFFIYAPFNIATAIILGSYTYVNETFNLYNAGIERRVAAQKTQKQQLDFAKEDARRALLRVAALMNDERCCSKARCRRNTATGDPATQLPMTGDIPAIVVETSGSVNPVESYLREHTLHAQHLSPVPSAHESTSDGSSSQTTDCTCSTCASPENPHRHHARYRRRRRRGATLRPADASALQLPAVQFFPPDWVDRDVIF